MKLAQKDLELRGAGEIYGLKQSGHYNLKVADLKDQQLIISTNQAAQQTLLSSNYTIQPNSTIYPHLQYSLEKNILPN